MKQYLTIFYGVLQVVLKVSLVMLNCHRFSPIWDVQIGSILLK